jgi:hypothetical protein
VIVGPTSLSGQLFCISNLKWNESGNSKSFEIWRKFQ